MRSFSQIHESNANEIMLKKRAKADSQRVELLSAIKKTYGISNFNTLAESEKNIYRNIINEMWDPIEGLNDNGIKFVNESEIILSNQSSNPEIVKFIEQEFMKNMESYLLTILNKKVTNNKPVNVRAEVEKFTGKKFKPENFKKIFKDIINSAIENSDLF